MQSWLMYLRLGSYFKVFDLEDIQWLSSTTTGDRSTDFVLYTAVVAGETIVE